MLLTILLKHTKRKELRNTEMLIESGKRKLDNRGELVHLIETVEKFTFSDSNIEIK